MTTSIGELEILAAVTEGLIDLGMPSPERNCRISVQWEETRCGIAVSFPPLSVKYAGSSDGGVYMVRPLVPMVAVTHDQATTASNEDFMHWVKVIVPREALWRMRQNLIEKRIDLPHKKHAFRWPREWPIVHQPKEIPA